MAYMEAESLGGIFSLHTYLIYPLVPPREAEPWLLTLADLHITNTGSSRHWPLSWKGMAVHRWAGESTKEPCPLGSRTF